MVKEISIRVRPETATDETKIKHIISKETATPQDMINGFRILKRSIDARQKNVLITLYIRVFINEPTPPLSYERIEYNDVSASKQVIIVGAGPGGLFAALRLIELGVKPVVIERGKDVHERKKDIALISRENKVNPESNYCFGEGGAGAFSDGKLFTRSHKHGSVERILTIFHQHGASESILIDAHPHIGTDKLPRIIENIRNTIIGCGGEVHFNTRMKSLIIKNNVLKGIITADGREFTGPVILATGHSARDVYRYLAVRDIEMEAKAIAIGVRVEHPQELIDRLRYHSPHGRGEYLPPAEYSFASQINNRGVYSFCMCPGGFVVPATNAQDKLVVNGMSPSNRGSQWANSGIVVEIRPEDVEYFPFITLHRKKSPLFHNVNISFTEPIINDASLVSKKNRKYRQELCILEFQEYLERQCWLQGGRRQTAPAQRLADFMKRRPSLELPTSSYSPGLVSSDLHSWIPQHITSHLMAGLNQFNLVSSGFVTNEATLIGIETRTSSPVRILRDAVTLQHVRIKNLFPCGEGAGYSGGIVSSAIDGELCADRAAALL